MPPNGFCANLYPCIDSTLLHVNGLALNHHSMQVSEQELVQALEAAVTCCILAAAGPQRSRVLANLYKDERTRTLPVFPFLEKVYLERILRREEVCVVYTMCKTVLCVFWDKMFVSCGGFRCSELLAVDAHNLHDHTPHDIITSESSISQNCKR